VFNLKVDL